MLCHIVRPLFPKNASVLATRFAALKPIGTIFDALNRVFTRLLYHTDRGRAGIR
jgi:hypothetical protein